MVGTNLDKKRHVNSMMILMFHKFIHHRKFLLTAILFVLILKLLPEQGNLENIFKPKSECETSFYQNEEENSSKMAVVIFASHRGGSSFVGQLFNQHKDIFYLFEPLHPFGQDDSRCSRRIRVLHDLMRCIFKHIPHYYQESVKKYANDRFAGCARNNMCFKERSSFLNRAVDLCPNGSWYHCKTPFDPQKLTTMCQKSLLHVAKVIAEPYLSALQPLFDDPHLPLRVIHLVRDPRAILASRRKILFAEQRKYRTVVRRPSLFAFAIANEHARASRKKLKKLKDINMRDEASRLCVVLARNLEFVRKEGCRGVNRCWKGRYLRVRYEDVSSNPLKTTRELFKFVGLNFDSSVKTWIASNTRLKQNMPISRYSTYKNSRERVSAWRNEMNLTDVKAIQDECSEVNRKLKYRYVRDETQLRNLTYDLWYT